MMQGKKILLGVTGSIAAYKTPELVRQLVKQGADVRVILTKAALDFVSPLALSTVSKNEVYTSFTDETKTSWVNHVDLGLWCDLLLVAPASANTIARFTTGVCDNLLTAVYLSCRSKVCLAPAMDVDMYAHFSTQNNIETLKKNGVIFIGPESGELASGLTGAGRMSEPETIVAFVENHFSAGKPLSGKKAVVTAGPTFEAIDPVRFIGNHSSGKMGIAIANELMNKGATVTLIAGPGVKTSALSSHIKVVNTVSADDMLKAAINQMPSTDIMIMAAAVADFTPKEVASQKIKKNKDAGLLLDLKPTTDIAKELGSIKKKNQLLVGFALETNDQFENAKKKLKNKNLDFIVLNSLDQTNNVFNSNNNKITIIDSNQTVTAFEMKPKTEVAADIVDKIITLVR